MSSWVATIGFVAGVFTSTAAAPQIYKTFKTREGAALSYEMIFLTIAGVSLWIVYGALLGLVPLILWNCLSLIMFVTLLLLKRFHCVDHPRPSDAPVAAPPPAAGDPPVADAPVAEAPVMLGDAYFVSPPIYKDGVGNWQP